MDRRTSLAAASIRAFRAPGSIWALAALGLFVCSCRKGTENQSGGFVPIAAAVAGTQGCGPLPPAPATLTELTLSAGTQAVLDAFSRLAPIPGATTAYVTCSDASVRLLDFSVSPVTDTILVNPGTIDTLLGLTPGSAILSGIVILDLGTLVVAEHSTNTLIDVARSATDDVALFAGTPSTGGFLDGQGASAFFRFEFPVELLASLPRTVYVCDTGNHAIRRVDRASRSGFPSVVTIAGNGAPGFQDGALTATAFDTPTGLTLTCPGEMIVAERGFQGMGGNRLRLLRVGGSSFFGGFDGFSITLAGDGSAVTVSGLGVLAGLAEPSSPVLGAGATDTLVYWVDASTGVLRRYDFATEMADCPLDPNCGATFPAGMAYALVRGGDGLLYALQGDTARMFRIDP